MASAFQKRIAAVALQEFEKYRLLRENQEPLASRIRDYWNGIGLAFPGVDEAWSAVFVSWCTKQAGATAHQFKFSAAHSRFVHQAIQNAQQSSGVFHGRNVADYAPKLGDILQNNRTKAKFDFQFAATHKSYLSHSAIVVEVGTDQRGMYLRTIGGNESDSVGMKEVRLKNNGLVNNSSGLYIAVVETLL